MTTPGSRTPTRVPGLLLRPVIWPEEAQLMVDVNNASHRAGGSLFVMNVEVMRVFYDHLVNSELARDLRLAEADGRPVAAREPSRKSGRRHSVSRATEAGA